MLTDMALSYTGGQWPMPNRNRQAGDYFERRTRQALEADGWLVIRSAGSLGVADLVALKANRMPRIISCKLNGRISREATLELIKAGDASGAFPVLAWREKPGLVGLARLTRHGKVPLGPLRMPAKRPQERPTNNGRYGEQLTIDEALGDLE
jgi:Archaeal holliday junction resolvase (hjc)